MKDKLEKRTPTTPAIQADLLRDFFSGMNPKTVRAYTQGLEDFRAFIGAEDLNDAALKLFGNGQGAANGIVLKYKADLISRKFSPSTINQRLAALRSLSKMARILGYIPWAVEIRNVQAETYRDTRGPGRDAWQKLLIAATEQRGPKAARDVALLRMLHDLALRRAELAGIDWEDVDLERAAVSVLRKGRNQKTILTMPGPTVEALRSWMNTRDKKSGPLFVNFDHAGKGERLTGGGVYEIVRSIGAKVGINTRPHGLRHLAITEACKAAVENGIGLEEVRDFSGHKSVSVLIRYRDAERNVQGKLAAMVATA